MKNVNAHINSLGGQMDEVQIISENGNNNVVALYKDKRYTAVFNPFTCSYYVDDKYGEVK